MSDRTRLRVVAPGNDKLGHPTIMDRALAQRYGSDYVHLAAFAIDIDRLRAAHAFDPTLPFAWEVALTELRIKQLLDETSADPARLLEDMCLAVMELPRPQGDEAGPYGSQFPFAVYTGWARGILPDSLESCFHSWNKLPEDLYADVSELIDQPARIAKIAARCLTLALTPPLVAPVRDTLGGLAAAK